MWTGSGRDPAGPEGRGGYRRELGQELLGLARPSCHQPSVSSSVKDEAVL